MHDEMNDLAPALLMAVIVAIGLVAFLFRAELASTPANASVPKKMEQKAEKTSPKLAMDDRLYWIR